MPTTASATDHQLAVLVDFENVGLDMIQWLFDQLSDVGRVIVKKAYGDWTGSGGKRDQLLELGIEPIQVFHAAQGSKNSSDIRLTVDAVDLLYQSPVDTFVIVSSDSDFVSLVARLRAAGKTVIGAGVRETTPHTLVVSCDRYFYLEKKRRRQRSSSAGKAQKADGLLTRAVEASMDEQGRVVGSKLHQTLQRLDPGFDFRSQGYSTFTKFLEASPEVRVVRSSGAADVAAELAEGGGTPEGGSWEKKIDQAWARRAPKSGQTMQGARAAAAAAKFLGVQKLSASRYKTLQGLLDASDLLRSRWRREGNAIIRQ